MLSSSFTYSDPLKAAAETATVAANPMLAKSPWCATPKPTDGSVPADGSGIGDAIGGALCGMYQTAVAGGRLDKLLTLLTMTPVAEDTTPTPPADQPATDATPLLPASQPTDAPPTTGTPPTNAPATDTPPVPPPPPADAATSTPVREFRPGLRASALIWAPVRVHRVGRIRRGPRAFGRQCCRLSCCDAGVGCSAGQLLGPQVGEYRADVAETAATLRVPQIAGALSSLNTGSYCRDDAALAHGGQLRLDTAWRVPKAVAHEHVVRRSVLLKDAFTDGVLAESMLAIDAVIDDGAVRRSTEAIVGGGVDLGQGNCQQRLQCEDMDGLPRPLAIRTCRTWKRGRQITGGGARFGRTSTRVSHTCTPFLNVWRSAAPSASVGVCTVDYGVTPRSRRRT